MHQVLLVYKQVELLFDENGELYIPAGEQDIHTVSYDEKPGIQAISTTLPDMTPTENHGTIKRDYEYRRSGTVSLLAGIDLLTGEAIDFYILFFTAASCTNGLTFAYFYGVISKLEQ